MIHKIMSVFAAFAICMFAGCDFINSTVNNVNAETYAEYAGKAVAVIVNTSDKYFKDSTSKVVFTNTLSEVIAKMPKDIAYSNVTATVNEIVVNKINSSVANETQKAIITTAVTGVYAVINKTLESLNSKYEKEFSNAETTYTLVMKFLNSAYAMFETNVVDANGNAVFAAPDNADYVKVYEDVKKLLDDVK